MNTMTTVKSEEARVKMRDILDEVTIGGEVIIERYAKPTAVVIGYKQWQALQVRLERLKELELRQEIRRVRQGIANGEIGTTSHDELKRLMLEKQAQAGAHVGA